MGVNYSGSYAVPRLDLGEAFKEYLFMQGDFIGLQVLARFDTPKKQGTFSTWKRESLLLPGDTKRAPRAAYNRGSVEAGDVEYACEERGHETPLDDSEREFYASDFDSELACSQQSWWRVAYDVEVAIRDKVIDTTNFTTANGKRTDVSTAWSDPSADIIGDVQAGKEAVRRRTGMSPNVLVVGAAVVPYFLKNTAIRAAIQPTQLPTERAIMAAIAMLFGLEEVVIGKGVYNSADEGQAASVTDVWGSGWASLVRRAPTNAPLTTPCLGRTMVWIADVDDAVMTEEYYEPQTRSMIYRSRAHTDELQIDTSFAQLLDIAG